MNRKAVMDFAVQLRLGPPSNEFRPKWVNYSCPFAPWTHQSKRDRSKGFGITCDEGEHSKFFCLTCHARGPFSLLPYSLGRRREEDLTAIAQEITRAEVLGPRVILPSWEDVHLRTDPSNETLAQDTSVGTLPPASAELNYLSAVGQPYLRERKITAFTAAALGLRYDRVLQRILFPVRDYRGRFAGFSGRSVIGPAYYGDDDKPYDRNGDKYLKVKDYFGLRKLEFLLGEDTALRLRPGYSRATPIIVCEGLFDFAWLRQLGYWSTVATMGTWLTEPKIKRLRSYNRPIISFMDNDEAGRNARDEIVRAFWGHVPILDIEYPEGTEDQDPHSLTPEVVHRMLRNTKLVTTAPLTNNVATASF